MALSGYFNGATYDETFLARRVAALVPNGVYDGELQVKQYVGMQVKVDFGRAWINGYFYDSSRDTQEIVLSVPTADGSQPRKDSVMLRMDLANKTFGAVLVQGVPGSNPAAPGIVRDGVTYDLKLAEISVPAGIASITTAQIHDTRPDSDVCGYTAGFKSIDMGALMAEYQAQFTEWFQHLADQLDDNQAGNLQHQIDAHTARTDNPHGVTAEQAGAIPISQKGAAGGVASLDAGGKLVQMPTYADVAAIPADKPTPATVSISYGSSNTFLLNFYKLGPLNLITCGSYINLGAVPSNGFVGYVPESIRPTYEFAATINSNGILVFRTNGDINAYPVITSADLKGYLLPAMYIR